MSVGSALRPYPLTGRLDRRRFEANFGQQTVTVSFHALGAEPGQARLLRRGSRMDVLL